MHSKPIIWIVDTSVFLNVLNVPGRNQDREAVLAQFKKRAVNKDWFLLPFASIVETGNHIAQLSGDNKFRFAQHFEQEVRKTIEGDSPWKPMDFPEKTHVLSWLTDFPQNSAKGIGFADHSIIKQWERQCDLMPQYSVRIWAIDSDLQGYSS
jgi:hypothetical protein